MTSSHRIVTHQFKKQLYRFRGVGLSVFMLLFVMACHHQSHLSSSATAATNCRIVQHAMGESCVPFHPQRVIVLSGLDSVLALGVQPIGIAERLNPLLRSYLDPDPANLPKMVGLPEGQPNLEAVLQLQPDLILGTSWDMDDNIYAQLSEIAPTISVRLKADGQWKEPLIKFAEALGKPAAAEAILANYHARLAEFQAKMGDRLQQLQVSLVRIYPDGIAFYLSSSFAGSILKDAGIQRPAIQAIERSGQNQQRVDRELLNLLDADVMFVWTYGYTDPIAEAAQHALGKLETDPLWQRLSVVQRDQVYPVPAASWFGFGPIAANEVIDDLFSYLLKTSS